MPVSTLASACPPLPPLLSVAEPGSFARSTIVERKPLIIRRVIDDNGYPPPLVRALDALRDEIAHHAIQPLTGSAPDTAFWNGEAAAFRGRTWLELPWYFAETFFYRRLLEAVRYFEPGPWQGLDPFRRQKEGEAEQAARTWGDLVPTLEGLPEGTRFEALLHSSLWGNRADLSNYTVRAKVQAGLATRAERHNLLLDHTGAVAALLTDGCGRIDLITDNAGKELLADLALADFLLGHGWVQTVVFHLKDRPFFVSDAMPADLRHLLDLLAGAPLGRRLAGLLDAGRLQLRTDPFWTTCWMLRQMPPSLVAELSRSSLVILKGDANYRRLLDDRHWPFTTPVEQIAAYFPAPLLLLRTLKGEIMAGLAPGQAEALSAGDPTWLINGRRGIIQYLRTPAAAAACLPEA